MVLGVSFVSRSRKGPFLKRLVMVVVLVLLVVALSPAAFAADRPFVFQEIYGTEPTTGGGQATFSLTAIVVDGTGVAWTVTEVGGDEANNCLGEGVWIEVREIDSSGAYVGVWTAVGGGTVTSCRPKVTSNAMTSVAGWYAVAARAYGYETAWANPHVLTLAKTTAEFELPNAPALGCAGTFDGVALDWTHSGMVASGFTIQRAVAASGSWSDVHTAGASVRAWEDRPELPNLVRDYRMRTTNGPSAWSNTCTATTGQTATGEALPTPDVTDPEPGADEGESCAVWNLFCHVAKALRWAFVPGASTADAWRTFSATVSQRPPMSAITWAYDLIGYGFDEIATPSGSGFLLGCIPITGSDVNLCIQDAFDPLRSEWGWVRGLMAVAMWGGLAFYFWRQVESAVRNRGEDSSEVMEE